MTHLEKDILKGKKFKKGELKKEAREELIEVKGKKKGRAMGKALENKKRECDECGMKHCTC